MILIVGAGPTGLAAAHELNSRGHTDWLLVEQSHEPGGLSGSINEAGYTWDHGGHVVFSHYEEFDKILNELFEPEELIAHDRSSFVWIEGTWIPYPLQGNCHLLPEPTRSWAIRDALAAPGFEQHEGSTFNDYCINALGTTLTELFMRPYNKKVWTVDLTELGTNWLGERVQGIDKDALKQRIETGDPDIRWGPNNQFLFPASGGTGEIWRRLDATLPTERKRYEVGLSRVDMNAKTAKLTNGQAVEYDQLIYTGPLNELCRRAKVPTELRDASRLLQWNSTFVVGVGVHGPVDDERSWLYFPEMAQPFYRATNFTHYAESNSPAGTHSWMCEIGVSPALRNSADEEQMMSETVAGLEQAGLIDHRDIAHVHSHWIERAYPLPTPMRDSALDVIQPYLEENDIYSRGRFGAWKYESQGNQDMAFTAGMDVVRRILDGSKERCA